LCKESAIALYEIREQNGSESKRMINRKLHRKHADLKELLDGEGLARANNITTKDTDKNGLHLCFRCAAQSLPDVYSHIHSYNP